MVIKNGFSVILPDDHPERISWNLPFTSDLLPKISAAILPDDHQELIFPEVAPAIPVDRSAQRSHCAAILKKNTHNFIDDLA